MGMQEDYLAMTDGNYRNPNLIKKTVQRRGKGGLVAPSTSQARVTNSLDGTLSNIIKEDRKARGLGMNASIDEINQMRNTNKGLSNLMSNITTNTGTGSLPKAEGGNNNIFITHEDHNLGKGFYNPYTKLYGTKATRNNNPGNISGMGGKLLYGASKIATSGSGDAGDKKMLVFDTPEQGWRGMKQIMSSDKYNNAPIETAFSKYQTDQDAWGRIKNELKGSGVDITKTFNQLTPKEQIIFMNNRARHEGYKGIPLNLSMM